MCRVLNCRCRVLNCRCRVLNSVTRTHTHKFKHSVGPPGWLIGPSLRPLPGHHTKFTTDTHPYARRDSNQQFQNHSKRVNACALHHSAIGNSLLLFLAGQSTEPWPCHLPFTPESPLNRPLFTVVLINGTRYSVSNTAVLAQGQTNRVFLNSRPKIKVSLFSISKAAYGVM
jgi:hypothetical protein